MAGLPGVNTNYQTELTPDTLYRTSKITTAGTANQGMPNIEVIGSTATIYGSQVKPDSAPDGMSILATTTEDNSITGLPIIPNFLYVQEIDGVITSIVISNVVATVPV